MKSESSDLEIVVSIVPEDDHYDKFTKFQKFLYLGIVSLACFLSPISTTMFLPAVPEIAKEFDTTEQVITSSNAIYCIFMAVSSFLAPSMSNNYGRKWTTIICAGMYTIAAILTSQSQNVAMFFVFRSIMALFGTSFFGIGAIVIRDIFIPEERGRAMGVLLVGSQAGLAVAAVIGGIITQYTHWQVIFYLLTGLGGLVFLLALFCLKETGRDIKLIQYQKQTGKKFRWFSVDLTGPFSVMKWLPVSLSTYACSTLLYNMFSLLTPISYVIKRELEIESTLIASLFYLAPGAGLMVGSLVGGKYSDSLVQKYINRKGKRVAEDRLRACMPFFAFFGPISILVYGWCLQQRLGGIAAPVVLMFIAGLSQCMAFPTVNSYVLDAMPMSLISASVSNSYVFRFLFAALANGTILPQIDGIGVGWTCTISAFMLWSGALCSWVLVHYGEKWRSNILEKE